MKRWLAILLALATVLTLSMAVFADDKVAKPGTGPEMSRPNDSADVFGYDTISRRQWNYFEAETAELLDGAKENKDHAGYHGTGCASMTCWESNPNATSSIIFTVKAVLDGEQDIYIGYDNGHAWAQSANLIVNGASLGKIYFPTVKENAWAAYGMVKKAVSLTAGENTIALKYDREDYPSSFNIDFVAISKGDDWKDEAKAIKLTIGQTDIIKITENGEETIASDVAPQIKQEEGRTYIPVRGVFELAGATVTWNDEAKSVIVKTEDASVAVAVGNTQARVNGRRLSMEGAPYIDASAGRTLIPLRFISENLGYKVDWDGETQTIVISFYED